MVNSSFEPAFAEQSEWIRRFVDEEIEPLDLAATGDGVRLDRTHAVRERYVRPFRAEVPARGLWSCLLTAASGGAAARKRLAAGRHTPAQEVRLAPEEVTRA